ncbi:hypothetical protein BOTBODRAFT_113261 [Botryobasidium botryosum FD-172 SS1]|uniref:Bacteriophage T5 Orf172 DNA-binding domain-containing protein n=1 Tax=Botryobasidium botryosum (strain FD-172 SS1) TaxID=930990 RepID=A0A067M9E4_BOTB1|nr:hypothetical protein BOTBODRAFT_113261 [Botryobasidium botryosum FD-172 SS1]
MPNTSTPYPHTQATLTAPVTPARIPNPSSIGSARLPFVSTPNLLQSFQTPASPPPSLPPRKKRASSISPPSPTASEAPSSGSPPADTIQCGGVTKSGKQCSRLIKTVHPLSFISPGVPIERYCFQHTKELLLPTGFYSRAKPTEWIKFEDWIPEYLTPETKAALRVEMEKPASAKDEPGYIYTYEIRTSMGSSESPQQVHLKVGRAINLVKRIDEWSKQCGSKEVILRGWWPGTIEEDTSLIKGKVKAGEKGKYCHRLERLVHLELADLSLNGQYLTPAFFGNMPSSPTSDGPSAPKSPSKAKLVRESCPDCGAVHKEIFTFSRIKAGKLKGKEWESIVRPVIEKWGGFVENLL